MKMVGMLWPDSARRCCSSRPLRPGRSTSRTRQPGASTPGCARKSSALANASTLHPAQWIRCSTDSRTEASLSTTKTTPWSSGIEVVEGCEAADIDAIMGPSLNTECQSTGSADAGGIQTDVFSAALPSCTSRDPVPCTYHQG